MTNFIILVAAVLVGATGWVSIRQNVTFRVAFIKVLKYPFTLLGTKPPQPPTDGSSDQA